MSEPIAPPNTRRMVGPDGLVHDVPVDAPPDPDYRPETPEDVANFSNEQKYGGVKGGAAAAAAGALESVPFVGGAAAKAMIPFGVEAGKYHPIAQGAGAIGGTIAQTIALGGIGEAVGLGGDALEGGSMLERAAARAAQGAAEGGLVYGPGQAVNNAVLNDHPLTAEYLLASAGGGALLGGMLAGGLSIGGDVASKGLTSIGNHARVQTLAKLVDQDSQSLIAAGLPTSKINQLFADGTIKYGDTPIALQSRLAGKVEKLSHEIAEAGQRIDGSGQTFDLPAILKSAKLSDEASSYNQWLQLGDNAAGFGRAASLRSTLLQMGSADAEKLAGKITSTITEKAGAIEEPFGQHVTALLEDHASFSNLSKMADEAVAGGVEATAGGEARHEGAFGALLRQGEHIATWGMLGHFAGSMLGGHAGLGLFLAESAGNVLHEILENPAAIGEKFAAAREGIARMIGSTDAELSDAIGKAVERTWKVGGPRGGGLGERAAEKLLLPSHATSADIEEMRQRIREVAPPVSNGNQKINEAVMRQRSVLAQSLPQTPAAALPSSLARRADPPAKQIAIYNDAVRALVDPIGTIAGIGHGKATVSKLAAVRAGYPALATKAAAGLLNKSAASGKTAHASLRRAIEVLSGKPLDPAFAPAKIARIQAVFAPPQPPGRGGAAQGGGAVKLNQKGLANIGVAERMNAMSQPRNGEG